MQAKWESGGVALWTSALDVCEWSTPCRGYLTPGKSPGTHCDGGWVDSRAGENLLPQLRFSPFSPYRVALPTTLPRSLYSIETPFKSQLSHQLFWYIPPFSSVSPGKLWRSKSPRFNGRDVICATTASFHLISYSLLNLTSYRLTLYNLISWQRH